MPTIQIDHLTFGYPGSVQPLFEDVTLRLDTGWKLGFVGRNGRGKTTFLRLLLGQLEGRGAIRSPVPFDYFPYPVQQPHRPVRQVLPTVCPAAQDWELERELSLLQLRGELLDRPFDTLSHGEQTKVLLAALFRNEDRFHLIDEPTNHLDALGRALVSAYLRRKQGFLLVSHDRQFLDGCVDHILSLNRSGIQLQSGNFSSWFANFQQRQDWELARNEKLKKEIGSLQASARQAAAWAGRTEAAKYGAGPVDRGYIGHKAAKMMKRSKALEGRRQRAVEEKKGLLRDLEEAEPLKLSPLPWGGGPLVCCTDAAPQIEGRAVCRPVSFSLFAGDRLFLDGANGSGKSSLLRLLDDPAPPHQGIVRLGSGLVISRVPQSAAGLRGTLADFAADNGLDESLFKAILRKLDFGREQLGLDIQQLSAGQQKKILLARSLCQRAHLYVWDEPLNYIDLYSRIQLEELIRRFAPTMLLVEHDLAFRQAVATGVIPVHSL